MSRPERVEFPGAYQHIYARGVRRGPVFTTDESREVFLDLLGQLPGAYGVEVHAYVLMGNHYHFMAHSREGRLSDAMHYLGSTYASWFNGHVGFKGAVFSTRFNNRVVEAEVDWMHLLAYQHLNPFRAGMVADPEDYPWSSLGAYLGRVAVPPWLTTGGLARLYGGAGNHRSYLDEVIGGRELGPPDFHRRATWGPCTTGSTGLPTLVARPLKQGVRELTRVLGPACLIPGGATEFERALATWWLKRTTLASEAELVGLLGVASSTLFRRAARIERLRKQGDRAILALQHLLEAEALEYLRMRYARR